MKKESIQRMAYQRMTKIEELCSHGHVAVSMRAYWLLNLIVAEGFRSYFESYGLLPIHHRDANDGRQSLGMGQLSQFERDVLGLLSQKIQARETSHHPQFRVIGDNQIINLPPMSERTV
jgi:hypothetical protein